MSNEAEAAALDAADGARCARDENTLAVLRNPWFCVEDPDVDAVAEFFLQRRTNDTKRVAFVMTPQVLDVLKEKRRRPMLLDNSSNVEEQRSLCLASEAMWSAECILLGDASNRKRLTRKTCGQQMMLGDTLAGNKVLDVTSRLFAKPCPIIILSVRIDLA